jgi:hypothetical protein
MLFFTQQLPKVEGELKKHAILYEEVNQTLFKIDGKSLIVIERQGAFHQDSKLQKRKAKVREKQCH